jgi:hypothetical protein
MTQGEVAKLASTGAVEESVQLTANPDDCLVYVVDTSTEWPDPRVWRSGQRIGVTLPRHSALLWAETDQVGIEHFQPVAGASGLRIVVEKDFRCLQPRIDEDESDNFPNLTDELVSCKES